jgi:hypothetical protein
MLLTEERCTYASRLVWTCLGTLGNAAGLFVLLLLLDDGLFLSHSHHTQMQMGTQMFRLLDAGLRKVS